MKVDCTCKRAKHSHGTRIAYIRDGCRCSECREAARLESSSRYRQIAYGTYDSGRVDAEPVRERIQQLREYGIGLKRISQLAGVSNATLGKIIYGDPSRNTPPRVRVERHVAERVLAVHPRLEYLGATVTVDGAGTRRRLRALVAIGWSQARLAPKVGMTPTNLSRVLQGVYDDVQARTARKVKAVYDELWNQPQTGHDWRSRISANRSKNYAAEHGWVSPLAWDDDTIDDPRALPETGGTGYVHAQERLAEVVFLLDGGCSLEVAAKRSGYSSVVSLQQACRRVGRADLLTRITTTLERAAS